MMKSMRMRIGDEGGVISGARAIVARVSVSPDRATMKVAPTVYVVAGLVCLCVLLVGCGGQQQGQRPDARLKLFHVLSSRIVILDTQAEVDGMVQNTGRDRFPYDVTLVATFYDRAGKVVGQAQGAAEDVFPGMTRPFILIGQVDSSKYSRMVITPVNLHERRYEKSLPTPPPVGP